MALHHVADQIARLPTEIQDLLVHDGKIESRLRRLEHLGVSTVSTPPGAYRLGWPVAFVDQDRVWRREIRRLEAELDALLDEHGTTLRDEPGIGPIAAATLVCEVVTRRALVASRSSRVGAERAPSRCRPAKATERRSGTASTSAATGINSALYIASVTQQRDHQPAKAYIERTITEGKTRREARRAHKRHLANRVIRRMWTGEKRRRSTGVQHAA